MDKSRSPSSSPSLTACSDARIESHSLDLSGRKVENILNEVKRKNYPKALKYLKEVQYHDSLQLSINLSDNIRKASSHYLQLQKIQENELIIAQQKFKETQYWWLITLIISIILLAALIGTVIFYSFQKRKQKKELKIQILLLD